jgi:hypothetical protein
MQVSKHPVIGLKEPTKDIKTKALKSLGMALPD